MTIAKTNITPYARGFKDGLITSVSGDTITVSAGSARDKNNNGNINLSSSISKTLVSGETWVEGSGNAGSGITPTGSTWYYVFVISKENGQADVGFDTDLDAANLLSLATGYSYYRRVGTFYADVSFNIFTYKQRANQFWWDSFKQNSSSQPPTTPSNIDVSTPIGLEVEGILRWELIELSSSTQYEYRSNVVGTYETIPPMGSGNTAYYRETKRIWVDTNAQINHHLISGAFTSFRLYTLGWIDYFDE